MAVRDDRSDVKQTTAGFRGPLMVQSLTSAKSKFLSLNCRRSRNDGNTPRACRPSSFENQGLFRRLRW